MYICIGKQQDYHDRNDDFQSSRSFSDRHRSDGSDGSEGMKSSGGSEQHWDLQWNCGHGDSQHMDIYIYIYIYIYIRIDIYSDYIT